MSKRLAICTLFEGSYHYGVGPLVNSLYASGFRGIVWAGYRGQLPPWAKQGKDTGCYWEYPVADDCVIRFLPLETPAHLTNYKPDFLLRLLEKEAPDCAGLFYLDPDIVVAGAWRYFEEWSECGVAVCEDVNSPFAAQHPRRVGWRRFYAQHGIPLHPGEAFYANGGFIGVRREQIAFLKLWKRLQDYLWEALGGAQYVGIGGGKPVEQRSGFANCFDKTDQDALNATIEAADGIPVSFANKQAMGFEPGQALLPHALGPGKPWNKCYLTDALRGLPPRAVDKEYWHHAQGPIRVFTGGQLRAQRVALAIASALGRFIRRN